MWGGSDNQKIGLLLLLGFSVIQFVGPYWLKNAELWVAPSHTPSSTWTFLSLFLPNFNSLTILMVLHTQFPSVFAFNLFTGKLATGHAKSPSIEDQKNWRIILATGLLEVSVISSSVSLHVEASSVKESSQSLLWNIWYPLVFWGSFSSLLITSKIFSGISKSSKPTSWLVLAHTLIHSWVHYNNHIWTTFQGLPTYPLDALLADPKSTTS